MCPRTGSRLFWTYTKTDIKTKMKFIFKLNMKSTGVKMSNNEKIKSKLNSRFFVNYHNKVLTSLSVSAGLCISTKTSCTDNPATKATTYTRSSCW